LGASGAQEAATCCERFREHARTVSIGSGRARTVAKHLGYSGFCQHAGFSQPPVAQGSEGREDLQPDVAGSRFSGSGPLNDASRARSLRRLARCRGAHRGSYLQNPAESRYNESSRKGHFASSLRCLVVFRFRRIPCILIQVHSCAMHVCACACGLVCVSSFMRRHGSRTAYGER
jgi:hypothetical protein